MLLSWLRTIAPDVFTIDPESDAEAIHNLTAGVKRHVAELFKIAFEKEFPNGKVVNYPALERAYRSREYATYRDDVEDLSKLANADVRKRRKDLRCPIEAVVNLSDDLAGELARRGLVGR
ncbi:hypothetical protein [Paraburkholderia sp. JPY419]|uniref:hypothetical protein n=1 Tax=Paraburkholderia sp. JPY419 TaxID=667660 RepID=UPI003D222AF3